MKSERGKFINRLLDFYLGIPIVAILFLFKKKPKSFNFEPKKIGVLSFAAIGDSVLSSTILISILNKYPSSNITIYSTKSNNPFYDAIKTKNIRIVNLDIFNPFKTIQLIYKDKNDIIIDTSQWIRISSIFTYFSGAKLTIGFKTKNQYRHFLYDYFVTHESTHHEINNFRKLLIPLNIISKIEPSYFYFNSNLTKFFNHNKKFVVIHPWAGGYNNYLREWPIESWIKVLNFLLSNNYDVFISGSKSDYSKSLNIISNYPNNISIKALDGSMNFNELASLICASELVISVNTGIMHYSAFLHKKLIALNGPTNAIRWGALGNSSININVPEIDGGQYLNLGFEHKKKSAYIMHKIEVTEVINTIKSVLNI